MTRQRVDKAAALQMVFEDAVVHIVDYLIRHTGSYQLALGGGTALNCVSNMNLLEHFDEAYYLAQNPAVDSAVQSGCFRSGM